MPESHPADSGTEPVEGRTVGVIGLGIMGGAMAERLLDAGHVVRGFDIDAAAVARFGARGGWACETPAAAARDTELLLLMVHNEHQVAQVLEGPTGALASMAPGGVIWLGSTVSPSVAIDLAARLAAQGIALIDGPVSGGATGAQTGDLVAICGGSPESLSRADFALRVCARHVYHVGPPGAGASVKMINQLLVAAHSVLTAEAMALARLAGVEPRQLIDVVSNSAGQSRIFDKRAPRIADGDDTVHVSVDTLRKDLSIVIEASNRLGLDPKIARAVLAVLDGAAQAGRGGQSDTTLIQDYLGPVSVP
ncbi:NAD(P)-dependent oxidoreductase [Hydrogenophaga sp.]|uniref:NAD(P)-dependent oxidoreductase n=1 Tax=Hydrogenophaga sp. TaxID=1904254 RepID=UPI00260A1146|nr:NAD(P)-dependent oxidoreductase [Hydrogenophaga sp.]MCW5654548.1 NAD(P)-dependent oxidoreductase [Hydrogenophaga sp.]